MMNWDKQGGAAFPFAYSSEPGSCVAETGMSLRDWFAGQVLTGLCSTANGSDADVGWFEQVAAKGAYRIADAMLSAREATP